MLLQRPFTTPPSTLQLLLGTLSSKLLLLLRAMASARSIMPLLAVPLLAEESIGRLIAFGMVPSGSTDRPALPLTLPTECVLSTSALVCLRQSQMLGIEAVLVISGIDLLQQRQDRKVTWRALGTGPEITQWRAIGQPELATPTLERPLECRERKCLEASTTVSPLPPLPPSSFPSAVLPVEWREELSEALHEVSKIMLRGMLSS